MSNNNYDSEINALDKKLREMQNSSDLVFNTNHDSQTQDNQLQTESNLDTSVNDTLTEQTENITDNYSEPVNTQTVENTQQPQEEKTNILESPSLGEKCFRLCTTISLPLLMLLTILLCGQQSIFPRDFWYSEEVRYADIYMNMLSSGNFFTLTLNGIPYAETNPLYFIIVWLIDSIPFIDMPQAFFGASILFSVLFISSIWLLAKGLGYSTKIAFMAGLVCLSTFFLAGLTNYSRMDFLFASFLNLSYLCFFRAWKKNSAPIWLLFAFLLLALACFTNTILSFIIPFIASIIFFIFTNKFKRFNSADGIIGFLVAILLFFAWFAYIYTQGKAEYISLIFNEQILTPYNPVAYKAEPLWYYALLLPIAFLPWIFVLLFANWFAWIKSSVTAFKARKEDNATAWLIILILSHIALFSIFKEKALTNLVPVLGFMAILTAKTIANFSVFRSKLFFNLLGFITICIGIFFILFEFHAYILDYLPNLWNLPQNIPAFIKVATTNTHFGLAVMGALFILLGFGLCYFINKAFSGSALLSYTVGLIIALQPLSYLVAPQLGTIFSTKNHALEMANYTKTENAVPASFGVYPAVFTYYYNMGLDTTYQAKTVTAINSIDALTEFLLNNDTVILAISEKAFDKLPYKNEAKILPFSQYIENQKVLLTLWKISANKPSNEPTTTFSEELVPNANNLLEQEEKEAIITSPNQKNNETQPLENIPQTTEQKTQEETTIENTEINL